MITLSVQTIGGITPFPTRVLIENLNPRIPDNSAFSRNNSFTENINLPSGRYAIIINGSNPPDGSTTVKLSGDFSVPPSTKQFIRNTQLYTIIYAFTI